MSPTVYVTQYHWPRIIGAGVVLLGLLVALYFWAASGDDDEESLASDGEIELTTPAPPAVDQPPVFVEPADTVNEPVPEPVNAAEALSEAATQQQIPVPRDTTRDTTFGSDRPLAESLSDQVHVPEQTASAPSVLAPESEGSKFRLTVEDEPVVKPVPASPSPAQGASPPGIMKTQSQNIARAVMTDAVNNSEPGELLNDPVSVASGRQKTVHLLVDVRDLQGDKLRLLWFHAGNEMLSLPVEVRTQKAVITSSMSIASSQAGDWQVEVRNESGEPLASGHFEVTVQ